MLGFIFQPLVTPWVETTYTRKALQKILYPQNSKTKVRFLKMEDVDFENGSVFMKGRKNKDLL